MFQILSKYVRRAFRQIILYQYDYFDLLVRYAKNKEVMTNLWNQISDIADFDKVSLESHFHFLRDFRL